MSIDKSTMKIFFEGMQGNMLSGGYTSKIITTPMGPFKWNDVIELWENVNNGMVMNNMSFQDMMTMGYDTLGGGADYIEVPDYSPILINIFGNLIGGTTGSTNLWSSINGPQTTLLNGSTVSIFDINRIITLRLTATRTEGSGPQVSTVYYSIDNGPQQTSTISGFTVANGQSLRIGFRTPNDTGVAAGATGNITLRNLSDNSNLLASVTWSYKYSLGPG